MLPFALAFFASSPANAADDAGWGDFPTSRPQVVEGERVVRVLRVDRTRFGRLPVKLDFRSEMDRSVRDVAVLNLEP